MKATLTFNLPEEKDEHRWATNAFAYLNTLTEILADMRQLYKYGRLPGHALDKDGYLKLSLVEWIAKQGTMTNEAFAEALITFLEATDLISIEDYKQHLFSSIIPDHIVEDL